MFTRFDLSFLREGAINTKTPKTPLSNAIHVTRLFFHLMHFQYRTSSCRRTAVPPHLIVSYHTISYHRLFPPVVHPLGMLPSPRHTVAPCDAPTLTVDAPTHSRPACPIAITSWKSKPAPPARHPTGTRAR